MQNKSNYSGVVISDPKCTVFGNDGCIIVITRNIIDYIIIFYYIITYHIHLVTCFQLSIVEIVQINKW